MQEANVKEELLVRVEVKEVLPAEIEVKEEPPVKMEVNEEEEPPIGFAERLRAMAREYLAIAEALEAQFRAIGYQ